MGTGGTWTIFPGVNAISLGEWELKIVLSLIDLALILITSDVSLSNSPFQTLNGGKCRFRVRLPSLA
jgi:hypothetical protein